MRLALGSDHAGFELKNRLAAQLREAGTEVPDVATHDTAPVDYPDFAVAVFVSAKFTNEDRHLRWLEKVRELESRR